MTDWLDETEQRAWRNTLRMHAQVTAALAQALRTDSDLSIADYEVLAILSEAPDGLLRARELRCELQWEKSRLAHQVRRMEQRGLVRREICVEDRRAPLVGVTAAGRATLTAAAPAHVARVRELFFDALTPAQVAALQEVTESVLAHLQQRLDGADDADT